MTSTETHRAELAAIEGHEEGWEFEPIAGIHHIRAGELKLSVKRGVLGINAEYTVRHDRYGVLRSSHPADSVFDAKRQAVAFAQAWVNQSADA